MSKIRKYTKKLKPEALEDGDLDHAAGGVADSFSFGVEREMKESTVKMEEVSAKITPKV
ncbi:hypothetical protein KHP62_07060 [Rhodobacteraceae bacterium NNCM2]|nr:hypothetical protein [Coraliihabitans acroporae]